MDAPLNATLPAPDFQSIEIEQDECRICLDSNGTLVTPCNCKGYSACVHVDCLNKWRLSFPEDHEKRRTCEICKSIYTIAEPHVRPTFYVGYLFLSTFFMSANMTILSNNMCNSSMDNIFCFWNLLLTTAHAAVCTRVKCITKEKSSRIHGSMFFPQAIVILFVFLLGGFNVWMTIINLFYFVVTTVLVLQPCAIYLAD